MVTAKKISTPKPVAVAPVAATKPVAVKKSVAKKTAEVIVPNPAVAAPPGQALAKPKAKAAKSNALPSSNAPSVTESAAAAKPLLSAEQRNNYVEVAAFYIAERRGFAPGNPADDWCAAELEVDRLLASGQFNT